MSLRLLAFLCLLCAAVFGPSAGALAQAGSVTGKVDLSAAITGQEHAQFRYPQTSGVKALPPPEPRAVVYVEGNFTDQQLAAARSKAKSQTAVLDQEGLRFLHTVIPILAGSSVSFPNRDDCYHNVFSYSKAKNFDLGRYLSSESPPAVLFDQPGVVRVFCEIHRHMRSTILVLDTPFFVLTDKEGNFNLTGLPPGEHDLVVWIDEKTIKRSKVAVLPGSVTRL